MNIKRRPTKAKTILWSGQNIHFVKKLFGDDAVEIKKVGDGTKLFIRLKTDSTVVPLNCHVVWKPDGQVTAKTIEEYEQDYELDLSEPVDTPPQTPDLNPPTVIVPPPIDAVQSNTKQNPKKTALIALVVIGCFGFLGTYIAILLESV